MPRRPGYKPDGPEIYRLRVMVHGLSAVELGAKIGYSRHAIWLAERGGSISDVFASRLAKALDVEVEDIASAPMAALDAENGPAAGTAGPTAGYVSLHRVTKERDTTQ